MKSFGEKKVDILNNYSLKIAALEMPLLARK